MPFLGRIVGICDWFACDYQTLIFSVFNLQYLKNIVFDVFLFINYENLGKSTIPSTVVRVLPLPPNVCLAVVVLCVQKKRLGGVW